MFVVSLDLADDDDEDLAVFLALIELHTITGTARFFRYNNFQQSNQTQTSRTRVTAFKKRTETKLLDPRLLRRVQRRQARELTTILVLLHHTCIVQTTTNVETKQS